MSEPFNKANLAAKAQEIPKPKLTTEQILKERGKVYGSFSGHAKVTQRLKIVFLTHMQQHNLEGYRRLMDNYTALEGLDMIMHKLGRIANGDPLYKDNWNDIAGYAKLVADDLEF